MDHVRELYLLRWAGKTSPMCTVQSNSQQIWPSLWPIYPQSAMRDRDHAIDHLIVWFNVNFSTRRWGLHPVGLVQPFLSTQRGAMSYKSTFRADNQENRPTEHVLGERHFLSFFTSFIQSSTLSPLIQSSSVSIRSRVQLAIVMGWMSQGSPTATPTGNSL